MRHLKGRQFPIVSDRHSDGPVYPGAIRVDLAYSFDGLDFFDHHPRPERQRIRLPGFGESLPHFPPLQRRYGYVRGGYHYEQPFGGARWLADINVDVKPTGDGRQAEKGKRQKKQDGIDDQRRPADMVPLWQRLVYTRAGISAIVAITILLARRFDP
jgi:hypothetical protein